MREELVIVGGSYAACEMAGAARENGYDGNVRIFAEENEFPYHRPPLSKAFLLGTADEKGLPLRGEKFYQDRQIDILLRARVVAVDLRDQVVSLADGQRVKFDRLALAMGARARLLRVRGHDLKDIFYLRSIADARVLKQAAEAASEIVVIGGGFIGLEAAAALAQRGKKIVVVEAQERLLSRSVAPAISRFLAAAHRARGVEILTNATICAIEGANGRGRRVILQDGRTLGSDIVIVGIGSEANMEIAATAGLACRDGIIVDPYGCTSRPRVVAAGDCAYYAGPHSNGGMRLESVQNAIDQARCAGASMAGKSRRYDALPWFWSDQYELKLQIAGNSAGFESCVKRPGETDQFSVFYFKAGICIAVDSINRPREHMSARRLLTKGIVTRSRLDEVGFQLEALLTPEPGSRSGRPSSSDSLSS